MSVSIGVVGLGEFGQHFVNLYKNHPDVRRIAICDARQTRVAEIARAAGFPEPRLNRLQTAVAEATMNAMEHGNQYDSELPVTIRVLRSDRYLSVSITDQGGSQDIPEHVLPDLDAKLTGEQSPRGWGLFLIENMVDEMHVHRDEKHHVIELIFNLKEKTDG